MGDGEIKVEVLVYPDGGTQVSVPPVDPVRLAPILASAAEAVRRAAESATRDLEPVTCVQCGAVPQRVRAPVGGTARMLPCGHAVDAGAV